MKKKSLFMLVSCYLICGALSAQFPLQVDMDSIVKRMIIIPPTVDEMHAAFTKHTKYGDEFADDMLNSIYYEIKRCVVNLHDAEIRERMKKFRRLEMPDSIQYEEERSKLSLRPPLSQSVISGSNLGQVEKEIISQVLNLQKVFDWLTFYKERNAIEKEFRTKEASVSVGGISDGRIVLEFHKSAYKQHQALWMSSYYKYSNGISSLQKLLRQINYGADIIAAERKLVLSILSDVQARALEALEKLVWYELPIIFRGEMIYQDLKILKYQEQQTQGQ